jgi:hypothetical protein
MKNIKLSKLNQLQIGGELQLIINSCIYGFTKYEMLEDMYLVFGIYGGGSAEIIAVDEEFTSKEDYKAFENKINKKFNIDIKILLDK